ncbi:MAG: hypothetical protein ACREHD_34740 [Pirellulales bacterium]
MKMRKIRSVSVICLVFTAALGSYSVAAPKAPPQKPKSSAPKKPNSKQKKPRRGEISISLAKPTDKQKADVEEWLDAKLEGTTYEIVSWGNVVSADIGGEVTRKGIELKYRGPHTRSGNYGLQNAMLVLNDDGQIVGDEGPAGFQWHNEIIRMGQVHKQKSRKRK